MHQKVYVLLKTSEWNDTDNVKSAQENLEEWTSDEVPIEELENENI